MAIQRGVSKRLVIGESTLDGVGFGAYLAEPVYKGGFIGEYIGEVSGSFMRVHQIICSCTHRSPHSKSRNDEQSFMNASTPPSFSTSTANGR